VTDSPKFLDIESTPPGHSYTAKVEPQETAADRNVRLFKDVVLFLVAAGFVLLIVWLCVRALLLPTTQPEEKKWAMSILTAAAGGLTGYLVKKQYQSN
jgi:hypothetical protein